jgi:ATP-binding cassette subfamily B protein
MSEDREEGRRRQGPPPHGPGAGEKPKDFGKAIGKLSNYMKRYAPIMLIAVIFSFVGTVISLIGPDKLRDITNLIAEGLTGEIDTDAIMKICITLAILYGISWLMTFLQGFIMCTVTQTTGKNLRRDIAAKINRLPLKYFDTHSYGDVLSRVTNDVDSIGITLNQSISQMIAAITLFFGSLFMMFKTNVIMTLTAVAAVIIGLIAMSIIMAKSQRYFVRQQRELGRINGHVEEIFSGHEVVKAYNGEEKAIHEFHQMNEKLRDSAWKAQFVSGMMMPIMNFIGNLGYVAVCVVGASLVLHGKTDIGTIVAFMIYIRLFTNPLSQMAQAFTQMQTTAAATERVFELLEEEEMSDESHKTAVLTDVKGNVTFEHVHFGYNEERTIINDFSAEVKAGQKVAIVGPTGAGKTTIVNLLMRFYELNGGAIKIDGIPTSELRRENVHDQFCMVLQDTWLFEGTIRDNIVYSKQNVSDEEVIRACKAVGLHRFIMTLPNGYDTVLGDKASLSAGQKQLVTIARAMVEDAPLLILDEATSSVDTRTEVIIQEAMDKLMHGRTSFVIAHRLSTIKNADVILVMKDGDIIEKGTHDELLEQGGFYAELYNSQFEEAC